MCAGLLRYHQSENVSEAISIGRKLKCISIQEDGQNNATVDKYRTDADEGRGGQMVVGTNYGEIIVMNIGTQV